MVVQKWHPGGSLRPVTATVPEKSVLIHGVLSRKMYPGHGWFFLRHLGIIDLVSNLM